MIRRPPRSTQSRSSAASDVYKRQAWMWPGPWSVPSSTTRWASERDHECVQVRVTLLAARLLHPRRAGHPSRPSTWALRRASWPPAQRPFVLDSSAAQRVFALTPTPWDDLLAGLVEAYPHR